MRKGITLTEMLAAVFIISILIIVMAKPMRDVTVEIPRINRDFDTNTTMLDCVRNLRKDVENAAEIEVYPTDESVGGKLLMIGSDYGIICYQFDIDAVIKYIMNDPASKNRTTEHVWKIPQGKIRCQIWHEAGEPVAVEVTTAVARKIAGKLRDRLKNSYVFFIGANDVMEGQI